MQLVRQYYYLLRRTTLDVTIDAIDDDEYGADETIELSLLEGEDYVISSENLTATIDVSDNDTPTGIAIVPAASIVEEGNAVKFLISTSNVSNSDLTISLNIREVAGDYVSEEIPNSIVIAAGETTAIVSITTEHDGLAEMDGFIFAELTPSQNYTIAEEHKQAHVEVKNIDLPIISVVGAGSITEGVLMRSLQSPQILYQMLIYRSNLLLKNLAILYRIRHQVQ